MEIPEKKFGQCQGRRRFLPKMNFLARNPDPRGSKLLGKLRRDSKDRGMEMKMMMSIHMRKFQPCFVKSFKLGSNLFVYLRNQVGTKKNFHPGSSGIFGKLPVLIRQIGNFGARRHGSSVHQRYVKTYAERRILPGESRGFRGKRLSHHKACPLNRSGLMRLDNSFVDRRESAEIVSGKEKRHDITASGSGLF